MEPKHTQLAQALKIDRSAMMTNGLRHVMKAVSLHTRHGRWLSGIWDIHTCRPPLGYITALAAVAMAVPLENILSQLLIPDTAVIETATRALHERARVPSAFGCVPELVGVLQTCTVPEVLFCLFVSYFWDHTTLCHSNARYVLYARTRAE